MKVAVLVSGGVDSAVALRLMHQQGHEVTAFYLKIWLEDELAYLGHCPWQEDLAFVERICKDINVPLQVLSLQKEYYETVVSYTICQARAGNTPNPDVLCNTHIKFGFFMRYIGYTFDKVVTGHYAQTKEEAGNTKLILSGDEIKDQTYFLAYIEYNALKKALFPIGAYSKKQVREMATVFDLPNKERKDSQGICFLGMIKFKEFLKHHLGTAQGKFIEYETGRFLGTHEGAWFYTIGQRQGIGLSQGPWYVVAKDIRTHTVFISRQYHELGFSKNRLRAVHCNWISEQRPHGSCKVKLRHGPLFHQAYAILIDQQTIEVILETEDQGIAPGQFVAFYIHDECVGAGIIELL